MIALSLPALQHIRCPNDSIGAEKADGSRGVVIRPYTPSHTTVGYLELVIKEYPEGKMSKHICSLKVIEHLLEWKHLSLG